MTNKTKNITLLILIALTVLSFQVEAQIQTYGCTEADAINYNPNPNIFNDGSCIYTDATSNNAHGFNSTALVQIKSPTANTFIFNKLVIKYRVQGTSSWTKIVYPIAQMPLDSIQGGYIDTLGASMWFQYVYKYNSNGVKIHDGGRYLCTVRLKDLDPLTTYDTRIFLKGAGLFNYSNKTNTLSNTFTTWFDSSDYTIPTAILNALTQ